MGEAPWPFMTTDQPGEPNLPCELGAALGREVARMVDLEEARLRGEWGETPSRCHDCAAKPGSIPNQCAGTVADLLKCAIESIPFYCHHGEVDGEPTRFCRAWVALMGVERMTALMSKVVACGGCGQKNRVLIGKAGAACGRCGNGLANQCDGEAAKQ